MDISISGGDIAIRTAFDDNFDLVQVLRGVRPGLLSRNEPVDFRLAGLVRKGHRDIWHIDRALAFSTDECSPFVINGEDIGGNHGETCGLLATIPGHGCTCRDVGTSWREESGLRWTLLRVESPEALLFLSDNIGPSETEYAFARHISGLLRCDEDGRTLLPVAQEPGQQMTRAIRHLRCDVEYEQDGRWQPVNSYLEGVNRARIIEEYEVICPSTVAAALREMRPAGGCTAPQSLGVGKAMAIHRMTYRIEPDGCILCDFDHEILMDVRMTWYLGVMYQEKCDLGGGAHRYIPKLRPFAHRGVDYDFSRPWDTTNGPLPETFSLTPETWAVPDSPPDRQIDFLRREDGTCAVAFAGGFLPVFDGAPQIRRNNITDAGDLVGSRKTYPTFAGGKRNDRPIRAMRGVAYKRYFRPGSEASSAYTVQYDGKTWLYLDFFAPDERAFTLPETANITLMEASGLTWRRNFAGLCVRGDRGYALFCID